MELRRFCGNPPAQIPGAEISVGHGVGGMFAAAGTIIMSNEGYSANGRNGSAD